MKINKLKFLSTVVALLMLFAFTACDTAENNNATVSLTFSKGSALLKTVADAIVLDTVKILIRDIKIKNQNGKDSSSIKVGPYIIYLNLTANTTDFAIGSIPAGSYDRIKFEIHKIEASETLSDPEFREGTDESLRYSVIVKGKYNTVPFIYKSRKSAKQDLKLENPVTFDENGVANLTIFVDPFTWFADSSNTLDPTNPANESNIDNNIKESFKKAFRDNNHDGNED
ncbi:MAG: hypothetical protein Q8M94_19535 [Ignavibacteria bacterium]|nr:hypothetical protein [Ignavibacteria bacterium]